MTPEQLAIAEKLVSIFMPYATGRREEFVKRNGRFAHYTSAENGIKIIQTKCIWMRNTNCMSDFREVAYGFDQLKAFFVDENKKKSFFEALDVAVPGAGPEAIKLYDTWLNDTRQSTYITSISEHDGTKEDQHGRLSMWRAFNRSNARVVLVFKVPMGEGVAPALNLTLTPVAYFDHIKVEAELLKIMENVKKHKDFLVGVGKDVVVATTFLTLQNATVSLKHEGFEEEREWRVIYSPKRRPSPFISSSIETIDGIPQTIYKIPLLDNPDAGITGIDFVQMLDRVIIGPSQFPGAMYEAYVDELRRAGVQNPEAKVFISWIPIRT